MRLSLYTVFADWNKSSKTQEPRGSVYLSRRPSSGGNNPEDHVVTQEEQEGFTNYFIWFVGTDLDVHTDVRRLVL